MAARELSAALALAFSSAAAEACVPAALAGGATVVQGKRFALAYRTEPAPVPVSAHFKVAVHVCALDGGAPPTLVRVDATMPAHRHGMNYRPSVRRIDGDWHYRAEGLLFHMPGRWQYLFELREGGVAERLTSAVDVQ